MQARFIALYKQAQKFEGYFLVLVFANTILFQTVLFYLGINFVWNTVKQAIYAIAVVAYAIVSVMFIGKKIFDNEYYKPTALKCIVIIGIAGLLICTSFISFGISTQTIWVIGQFVLFCVPSALWGMNVGSHFNGKAIFLSIERAGIVMIPITVMYISQALLKASPFEHLSIGAIGYLTFGYGLLPFFYASVINFVSNETAFASVAKLSKNKCSRIVRPVVILLFWTGITCTTGRGAILSSLLFFGFLAVYLIIKRSMCKRIIIVGASCLAVLLAFQLLSIEPVSDRFSYVDVIDSVRSGHFSTAREEAVVSQNIDALISSDTKPTNSTSIDNPEVPEIDISYVKAMIVDRGSLYRLAWGEALDKPVTGLLPLGFTVKYGTYPHNVILELLSDLGLIVGGIITLFLVLCAIQLLFLLIKGPREVAYFIAFLGGMAASLMASGSVWNAPILCFCVCFSIAIDMGQQKIA